MGTLANSEYTDEMPRDAHPRLPRGEAFRFTPFIKDECSVTEWVTSGLPRMRDAAFHESLHCKCLLR